jgi:hypothetical protein
MYRPHHQGVKNQRAKNNVNSNSQLSDVVPNSLILFTLMMEAICSSETPVFTRATRRNIPEDSILRSHRSKNFVPYARIQEVS